MGKNYSLLMNNSLFVHSVIKMKIFFYLKLFSVCHSSKWFVEACNKIFKIFKKQTKTKKLCTSTSLSTHKSYYDVKNNLFQHWSKEFLKDIHLEKCVFRYCLLSIFWDMC